jgi:plastocyanin
MKTGLLIIIGISLVTATAIILGVNFMLERNDQHELSLDQSYLATDTRRDCGEKYIIVGNDECVLNPEFIEPNTIIIYDVTNNGGTRLSIVPHSSVIDLKDGDTVTFVNDGSSTVNISDNSIGIWSFDNVKPSSQKELVINGTGFYEFLVQNSREGESGEIVALSEDANSLPVEIRAKMAQAIVGSDFRKGVGLISVGSGGAEPGITIGIDEKYRDTYDDAEKFYYKKYKEIIPFEVPIWIEFTTPITFATG